jgi:hypothetical protein
MKSPSHQILRMVLNTPLEDIRPRNLEANFQDESTIMMNNLSTVHPDVSTETISTTRSTNPADQINHYIPFLSISEAKTKMEALITIQKIIQKNNREVVFGEFKALSDILATCLEMYDVNEGKDEFV